MHAHPSIPFSSLPFRSARVHRSAGTIRDAFGFRSRPAIRRIDPSRVPLPLSAAITTFRSAHVLTRSASGLRRDIKPENILVAGDETIKLCDFGLAINARTERPASRLGTLQYMAPEVVKRPFQRPKDMSKVEAYDEKVDMW